MVTKPYFSLSVNWTMLKLCLQVQYTAPSISTKIKYKEEKQDHFAVFLQLSPFSKVAQ